MTRFVRCLFLLSISWRLGAPAANARSSLAFGLCGAALASVFPRWVPPPLWGLAFSAAVLSALSVKRRAPVLPGLAGLLCQYSLALFLLESLRALSAGLAELTGLPLPGFFQELPPLAALSAAAWLLLRRRPFRPVWMGDRLFSIGVLCLSLALAGLLCQPAPSALWSAPLAAALVCFSLGMERMQAELSSRAHRQKHLAQSAADWAEELRRTRQGLGEERAAEAALALEELSDLQAALSAPGQIGLPASGLLTLDRQLRKFAGQCAAQQVEFELAVSASIRPLARLPGLSLAALQRLTGILTDNALACFRRPDRPDFGKIQLILGKAGADYRIEIADNGPPFPLPVLRRLGAPGNTQGGSGLGIPDLLETLVPCRASVLIQEYGEDPARMTKSLLIQFDGQGRRAVFTQRQALLRQRRNVYGFVFIPPEKGER